MVAPLSPGNSQSPSEGMGSSQTGDRRAKSEMARLWDLATDDGKNAVVVKM